MTRSKEQLFADVLEDAALYGWTLEARRLSRPFFYRKDEQGRILILMKGGMIPLSPFDLVRVTTEGQGVDSGLLQAQDAFRLYGELEEEATEGAK